MNTLKIKQASIKSRRTWLKECGQRNMAKPESEHESIHVCRAEYKDMVPLVLEDFHCEKLSFTGTCECIANERTGEVMKNGLRKCHNYSEKFKEDNLQKGNNKGEVKEGPLGSFSVP